MAGSEVKWVTLGDVIEQTCEQNSALKFGLEDVRGMTLTKEVIPTKANLSGNDLSKFQIVHPNEFIYNPRTHGKRIGLGYNNTEKPFLISWNNVSFKVKEDVIPEYLYMYLCRLEWDREACYRSWGSSTEVFSWDALCSMKFPLPSIEKQREIVAEWKGLREMKEQNEQIAQPLMELCQSYLDKCKSSFNKKRIGDYIKADDRSNSAGNDYPFIGLNKDKVFMPTVANTDSVDKRKYKVVTKDCFVFSGMQTGRDMCIRLGHYEEELPSLISPAYTTFLIPDNDSFLADYVYLSFTRPEMDRYCAFMTDSSVRANLDWNRFLDIELPCPPIAVQQAIVNIYKSAQEAKKIAEEADKLSNEICPALIQHVIHC